MPLARLLISLFVSSIAVVHASELDLRLQLARREADAARALIVDSLAPAGTAQTSPDVMRTSLGAHLADYANNPGNDPLRSETFVAASRRILDNGKTDLRAPDVTSLQLNDAANAILAHVSALEDISAGHLAAALAAARGDLHAQALIARFHARRAIAAVHYNLFKRGLRLAELVAATFAEKDAVAVWRELVATCGTHPFAADWRAELKKLEIDLKELEEQCCPPEEATLKEKVWEPARRVAAQRP